MSDAPLPGASTVALLVPRHLSPLLAMGGAELVCEMRAGRQRLFLRVPDESDGASLPPPAHTAALRQSRQTLWSDAHMRPFLPTSDPLTWPGGEALVAIAEIAAAVRETDTPPDFAAASALRTSAAAVSASDWAAGLHALRRPAAGPLAAFAAGRNVRRDVSALCAAAAGRDAVRAEAVAAMPLTARTEAALLAAVGGNAVGASGWADVRAAHTRQTAARLQGLFASVEAFLAETRASPAHVARLVADGTRVRLRVGVYVTVVHRREVFLRHGAPQSQSPAEDEGFAQTTGRSLSDCRAAGAVLSVGAEESVEDALRRRFLSPLAAPPVCTRLSPRLTRVAAAHNPFAIVHGPRVAGGVFPVDETARAALSALLASREADPSTPTGRAGGADGRRAETAETNAPAPTSAAVTGEQLRRGVDEAVIHALAKGPLVRAGVESSPGVARFRDMPNFDVVLRDALRRHAEYRGRKYYLRD